MLSPQTSGRQLGKLHPSPVTVLLSSHSSAPSVTPSPHTLAGPACAAPESHVLVSTASAVIRPRVQILFDIDFKPPSWNTRPPRGRARLG
jgi:hypothetical protein